MYKKLFAVTAIAIACITMSCNKNKTDTSIVKNNAVHSSANRTSNYNHLLGCFNSAQNLHNRFLALEYNSLKNGSYKLDDVPGLRVMDSLFFLDSAGYANSIIGGFNPIAYSFIANSNSQSALEAVIANDSYLNSLYLQMKNLATNGTSPATFNLSVMVMLDSLDDNTTIPTGQKDEYAYVLGASNGSYQYWNTNINTWRLLISPQTPQIVCESKWVDFFMRDCAGAGWGGYYGSILPGVGSAAGAVMGAAILSGMEAQSW